MSPHHTSPAGSPRPPSGRGAGAPSAAQRVLARHHVQLTGRGARTLVFVHGFGCSQAMWRHVAPAFEDDHRVVCLDLVGAGRSDLDAYDTARHATLHGHAEDLAEVADALQLHDAVLVGHSVGAMIGLLAARRAPGRFGRLVMIAPSACYIDEPPYRGGFARADLEGLIDLMGRNHLGWASFLAATVMQNPDRAELAEEMRASLCALEPRIAHQFACATFFSDLRAELPTMALPTLVMQCEQDPIAPPAAVAHVARALPNARLVRLAATGHSPHVSHPVETIRAIAEELRDADAAVA